MKKMNDFDFIKSKFEEENVTAPHGLDERAVMGMLTEESRNVLSFISQRHSRHL